MEAIIDILSWFSNELKPRRPLLSIADLSTGSIFLEVLAQRYPRKFEVAKGFVKPKGEYEIMQNFKLIGLGFEKLEWKRINPQKYARSAIAQQYSQVDSLARYIKKNIEDKELQKEIGVTKSPETKVKNSLNIIKLEKERSDLTQNILEIMSIVETGISCIEIRDKITKVIARTHEKVKN